MAASEASAAGVPAKGQSDLIEGFNSLNLLRQAGLMVGLAASVAVGFWVVLWTQGEDYKPLYGSLERMDANQIVQILDFNEIKYRIDEKSGALLVVGDQIHKARIKLAESGVPTTNTVGFELLDKEQPIGTSQFMETARYRRSLEGELARTITSVNAVRSARVHLAIPKQSVFVRDGREPSASVFLEIFPGRALESHQAAGIANLVAASISELKPENVTIIDQKGSIISTGREDKKLTIAAQQLDYTRKFENDIVARVGRLLTPLLGEEKFKTEVSADLDFTEIEQAEEIFNPDLPSVRSEQTVEETRIGADQVGGVAGALGNQPPADGQAPEQAAPADAGGVNATPSNKRVLATRNYELDRQFRHVKHEKGRLKRLTVAVVIDDKATANTETGAAERTPWTEAELERLSILVRDAVGYSAERGDSVNILNEPFVNLATEEVFEEPKIWEQDWVKSLIKQVTGLIVIAILAIGLLRPILKNLAASGSQTREREEARELAQLQAAGIDSIDSLSDETVTLTGGGESLALPSPEESYEQQLNSVKALVAEDAGRVAQVIKRWISDE